MDIFDLPENEMFIAGENRNDWFTENKMIKVNTFSILFCNKGTACIEIDFISHDVSENTQIIITMGTCIQIKNASEDFSASYIIFKHEIYDEITSRLEPSFTYFLKEYPCVKLSEKNIRKMRYLVGIMNEFYNEKNNCFREQIFKNYIQSFLLDIYDKTRTLFKIEKSEKVGRQEELFIKFIYLVYKYCPIEREVSFYAGHLSITPRYLSSIVQNIAGETAKNIIDKHTIQGIKAMLKSTGKTMQDISYELKFPDQSFFARYFKKHTGMSPQKYRFC